MFFKTNFSSIKANHAVVIGGSMAGLLAARVLTDHFEQVTIIERDRFSSEVAPRKGIPQAHHQHVLLSRGQQILNQLFPQLKDELIAAGAKLIDLAANIAWLTPVGWGIRFASDFTMLSCSRDLLEWGVRRQLATFTQVRFLQAGEVKGLLSNPDTRTVTGVEVLFLDRVAGSSFEQLHADLVVDASGRSSKTPQWLTALGYPPPEETVINAFLGYASRLYQPPSGFNADWQGFYLQTAPPNISRGCSLLPIEGDRWLLNLVGGGKDYPPTDEAGFLDFMRSLPSPIAYEAIKDAKPLSPIYSYRATENRWRHYERLSCLPDGLVVMGDAACAFNPVYGQGMSTAALGAITLNQCLNFGGLQGLSRRFQKQLAKVNTTPWMLATSEDFRYRITEGGSPIWTTQLMHSYMDQVLLLSTKSVNVRRLLLEVFNLLKPPSVMFQPHIILQVLGSSMKSCAMPGKAFWSQETQVTTD